MTVTLPKVQLLIQLVSPSTYHVYIHIYCIYIERERVLVSWRYEILMGVPLYLPNICIYSWTVYLLCIYRLTLRDSELHRYVELQERYRSMEDEVSCMPCALPDVYMLFVISMWYYYIPLPSSSYSSKKNMLTVMSQRSAQSVYTYILHMIIFCTSVCTYNTVSVRVGVYNNNLFLMCCEMPFTCMCSLLCRSRRWVHCVWN